MRRILLVLIAAGGLFANEAVAQDPQFSQFYAAPLYINPAFTGASEYTRFGVNYRNQWPSLNPSANFVTFSFYADHYLPNMNSGVGMIITTDREGTQGLQSTTIGLSYAYQLKLSDNLVFRPGLNVGYTTRDANFSNLVFASQIDPVNGFDPTLPGDPAVGANANLNASFVDISAGGILYSRNLFLGIAAHHINEPEQSILELSDAPSSLPMRLSIHGGYKITIGQGPLRKDLTYTHAERSLTPVFQYKSQGPFDILDVGAYLHLEPVNLGVWYRGYPLKKFSSTNAVGDPEVFPQNEALIFSIGVTTSDFNIGYSYDYTLSELGVASGGAHEFSIAYYLNFKKPQRVPRDQWKIPCPKNQDQGMTATSLLYLIIGIILFDYLLDQTLAWLNLRYSKTELPARVSDIYEEAEYEKSQRYQKKQARFSFITSAFSVLLSLAILSLAGFGYLDALLRPYFDNEILLSLAFFGSLFVLSDLINLPFQWYAVFVIEEQFGFNKTTTRTFLLDKIKGYLLAAVIGGLIGYVLLWLIQELGEQFWLYALAVMGLFILVMNLFYTSLILPLFNKLTPLEDGTLRKKIEEYASSVHFPLDSIFIIDGSKRSTKANAFFSGLGKKKKVVLYDTLVEKQSDEELIAVLAHEVGHFKKKHIVLSLVLSMVQMSAMLYVLSLLVFNPDLSFALGGEATAVHLNLIAFALLFSPISRLTGLSMNILSRKNEFEADAFAATTYAPEPLQESLKKLSVTSLSNLSPHPWYVFMHYSHPPLIQRLEALDQYKAS